jgi:hypothetical protein
MADHQHLLRNKFIKKFQESDTELKKDVIHSICAPLAFFNPLLEGGSYDAGLLFDMMYSQGRVFSELPLSLLDLSW